MMRFFFPSLFPTHSLSLSLRAPRCARSLLSLPSLSLSLSLSFLSATQKDENRGSDTHTRPSLYVFFFMREETTKAQFFFVSFLFVQGVSREEREEKKRDLPFRGTSRKISLPPVVRTTTKQAKTKKNSKYRVKSPAQNARHFTPRNSFSLSISSHLTFDDDYDDDDEQQQQ